MNTFMHLLAIVFGSYLLYETLEAAVEDNRGRGLMRGLRYTLTALFAVWLFIVGLRCSFLDTIGFPKLCECELDWSHIIGAAAISIRFLYNVEQRIKRWNASHYHN